MQSDGVLANRTKESGPQKNTHFVAFRLVRLCLQKLVFMGFQSTKGYAAAYMRKDTH